MAPSEAVFKDGQTQVHDLLVPDLTWIGLTPSHSRIYGYFQNPAVFSEQRRQKKATLGDRTIFIHAVHPLVKLFHLDFHNRGCVLLKNGATGKQKPC